ncbi:MAG TPA: SDR family NAD(P)-dependent oxidoreductase [Ktedonobacterales bacterium]
MSTSERAPDENVYALRDRVALITGANGALGAVIAQAFAASGARVIGVTRSEAPQTASDAGITYTVADVSDEVAVEALIARVVREFGTLDIVVNTVGGFAAGQPVTDLSLDTWEGMLSLNARTAFLVSKHAGRVMAERRTGRIINVASRSAYSGRKNAAAYAVSKRAVITLTEAQAEEMRGSGATVNAIVPSIIDTPANRAGMPAADTSRWPTPEQVARVVLFLASDDAALISGAAIPVYGDA